MMKPRHHRVTSQDSTKDVLLDIDHEHSEDVVISKPTFKSSLFVMLKYLAFLICLLVCYIAGYFTADQLQNKDLRVTDVFQEDVLVHTSKFNTVSNTTTTDIPLHCHNKHHYLLLNRHQGVSQDIHYLSQQLDFTFDEINKDDLWHEIKDIKDQDFLSKDEANKRIIDRLAEWACHKYPVIIVADINGDGRFLLQKVDRDPAGCPAKKIIFYTTNRFDFHASDVHGEDKMNHFHDLVKRVKRKTAEGRYKGPDIIWVANNPYESKYAQVLLGEQLMSYMIRPFGTTFVSKKQLSTKEKNKAVIYGGFFTSTYYDELKSKNIPVTQLDHDYGGPLTLAQYKAFIEFPYQVSTMKLYENLAAGVTMLIPSHRFYQSLMDGEGPKGAWYWGWHISDDFDYKRLGSNWFEYVDYYHKDFKDYIYYFDSYQELANLIQQPIIDTRNVKENGPKMYEKVRQKSLQDWKTVLTFRECIQSFTIE